MYYIDKRVVQSRELIVKTLIELLQNKPIHKVTIKELCEKSGVARTTFYRNNSSLEELLTNRLKDWYHITFDELFNDEEYNDDLILRFFKACQREFDLFRVIYRHNLESQVMAELQNCFDTVIRKSIKQDDTPQKKALIDNYPYSVHAFTGISQMSIGYWIENDTLTAEDITHLFVSYHNW